MKKVITIEPAKAHQPKKRLRVAAYCRVSSSMADQLVSLDAQKAHYEEYITSNPEWEFAGLYYDEGISGTKKEKRPALLQMMTDCENGKIDFIVTKSLSRFARNTTDCLELVRRGESQYRFDGNRTVSFSNEQSGRERVSFYFREQQVGSTAPL